MKKLIEHVEKWGEERSIIGLNAKATLKSQFEKLDEEVCEIFEAISNADQDELVDGIGDATVVLIFMARLAGTNLEQCLTAAFFEIADRKGEMVDGVFVKKGSDS